MKKILLLTLVLILTACSSSKIAESKEKNISQSETKDKKELSSKGVEKSISNTNNSSIGNVGNTSLKDMRIEEWNKVVEKLFDAAKADIDNGFIKFGDATMRFYATIKGDKPEDGYPLYIAMHGGGEGDTPDVNDEQWEQMKEYYSASLECGVYVAVRGVRDTWDTHFNRESYPIYDRLIQDFIIIGIVDPNRVYLEGFSAGGDGVYAIAPRMADRFAAANMSSGHPNNVNFFNMKNLPIQLQVGELDTAFDRHIEGANYEEKLNNLQKTYGGYEHRTLIHFNEGHNYEDYDREPIEVMNDPIAWRDSGDRSHSKVNSFPPDYMDNFIREPLPKTVNWDLSTRADGRSVQSFYYLKAPMSTNAGTIIASYDKNKNHISIKAEGLNGDFSILLNEDMIDFDKEVTFDINGKSVTMKLEPSQVKLEETTIERCDPNYQFEAEISYLELLNK